jgi:hypothetical protein
VSARRDARAVTTAEVHSSRVPAALLENYVEVWAAPAAADEVEAFYTARERHGRARTAYLQRRGADTATGCHLIPPRSLRSGYPGHRLDQLRRSAADLLKGTT